MGISSSENRMDLGLLTFVIAIVLQIIDHVLVKAVEAEEFIEMAAHKFIVWVRII